MPLTAINTWASIYTGCIVLDTATDFRLWWRTLPNARIELAMYARVSGYMSIGLSTDGSMHSSGAGSDVMLAWVSASGACSFGCVSDQWATARLQPSVDAAPSSLSNVRAGFEGAYMKVSFVRAQAASDAEGNELHVLSFMCDFLIHVSPLQFKDYAINVASSDILTYAFGATDTPSADGSLYTKHTRSGALSVDWTLPGCAGPPTAAPTPVPTPVYVMQFWVVDTFFVFVFCFCILFFCFVFSSSIGHVFMRLIRLLSCRPTPLPPGQTAAPTPMPVTLSSLPSKYQVCLIQCVFVSVLSFTGP